MNKKITLVVTLLMFICTATAQVGIGTTNPKQALHVAGVNSTIRVEGLSKVNNANNNGVKYSNVAVNSDGDLVLAEESPMAKVNLLGNSLFSASKSIVSNSGAWTTKDLASGSFNLSHKKWVNGVYEIGVTGVARSNGSAISDFAPRSLTIFLYIDGVQVSRDSRFFTSGAAGGIIVNGHLVLSGNFYKQLAAGNHTYKIVGVVYGGARSVKANFGGIASIDRLQIMAF